MSSPSLVVHLGFGFPPLTPNTTVGLWTDVSAYVEGSPGVQHSIDRGRNHERDEIETGTAIIILNNKNRLFDPMGGGPYASPSQKILPMVKIRIGALWAGTTYWMFYGYVESWTPEYFDGTRATCMLQCVDALKYFVMRRLATPQPNRGQEPSGNRITGLLDPIGWPAAERSIATGDVDVAEKMLSGTVLEVIQETAAVEDGLFYISRNGNAIFDDRSWRDAATPIATWGDAADGSELPYSSVRFRYDDSLIYNWIHVTRADGLEQSASDATSIDDFFLRTFRSEGLPYVDDTAALEAAHRRLLRYKMSNVRIAGMEIDPGVERAPGVGDPWVKVLERDISDLITIRRRTLIDSDMDEFHAHIEAIQWTLSKGLWICRWELSPKLTLTLGTLPLPATGSKWIPMDLTAGTWANVAGSAEASYWKDRDGQVYLRGYIAGGGLHPALIANLPVGYRPPDNVRTPVVAGSAFGYLFLQPSGNLSLVNGSTLSVDLSTMRYKVI